MRKQADKHTAPQNFAKGDWVFLKLQHLTVKYQFKIVTLKSFLNIT